MKELFFNDLTINGLMLKKLIAYQFIEDIFDTPISFLIDSIISEIFENE